MQTTMVMAQDVIPTISALYADKFARSLLLYEIDGNPPPVCLKKVNGGFYIIDGHHRTAVRRVNDDVVSAVVLENIDECRQTAPNEGELDFMLHQFAFVSAQNVHKIEDRPIDALILDCLYPAVGLEFSKMALDEKYFPFLREMNRASQKLREWLR